MRDHRGAEGIGRLHVITDTRPGRAPLPVVRAAVAAGAPVIQVRAKHLPDRDLLTLAVEVAAVCRDGGATCIVDDRVDVAMAAGAHGVHLGADDIPVAIARDILGPDAIVGGTARDPETARSLVADGADYLGVGPTYATTTKDGLPDPLGPARVGEVAAAVDVPVIAIAGIDVTNAAAVVAAGAFGVAVISAVSDADDPGAAVRDLVAAIDGAAP